MLNDTCETTQFNDRKTVISTTQSCYNMDEEGVPADNRYNDILKILEHGSAGQGTLIKTWQLGSSSSTSSSSLDTQVCCHAVFSDLRYRTYMQEIK